MQAVVSYYVVVQRDAVSCGNKLWHLNSPKRRVLNVKCRIITISHRVAALLRPFFALSEYPKKHFAAVICSNLFSYSSSERNKYVSQNREVFCKPWFAMPRRHRTVSVEDDLSVVNHKMLAKTWTRFRYLTIWMRCMENYFITEVHCAS
jgi:hypothetical protein